MEKLKQIFFTSINCFIPETSDAFLIALNGPGSCIFYYFETRVIALCKNVRGTLLEYNHFGGHPNEC